MFVGLNFLIFNTVKPVSVSGSFRLPGQGRPRVSAGQGLRASAALSFQLRVTLSFLDPNSFGILYTRLWVGSSPSP